MERLPFALKPLNQRLNLIEQVVDILNKLL